MLYLLFIIFFNLSAHGEITMQPDKIVDLTHEVHPEIPTWDLTCGYFIKTMRDYHHCEGDFKFRSQSFDIRASAGTHIDAPSHCYEGGITVSEIPIEHLIVPCIVIDVSHQKDPHYKATVQDIQEFEKKHGIIKPKSFVIFYTGWSRFWDEPKKYHNNLVFPSISADAAQLLVERNVVGLGIDSLSPDCDEKGSFVHAIILGAGKFIIENVANANKLPATGSTIFIMPLRIQGAAESPVRLIGLID